MNGEQKGRIIESVRKVLHEVYGAINTYVEDYIVDHWELPGWSRETRDSDRAPWADRDALMLYLWMIFPGGGTAEIAAAKIRAMVKED